MKRFCEHTDSRAGSKRVTSAAVLMAASAFSALSVTAATTDISNVPLLGGIGAGLKPNIMLLMDTSNSMSWTHMPDQLEVEGAKQTIGYKSSQCNSLYYNPAQTYKLPKDATNSLLPIPSFTAAPYNYYVDATTTVNLSTNFQAHDANTVRSIVLTVADTPQAAYYYVYSGTASLTYNTSPCTAADTLAANTTGTVSTTGGTWTRKLVTVAERENFAIWYTYYRTRMALAKSAIGLAFAPLDDSYRVGFLNGNPTIVGTGTSITPSSSVQSTRYEKIGDFDAAQKVRWFSKLYGQYPAGSSPTREALARAGRHYAGKTDGINQGMSEDPVQHSCQPNFTILTTDGYWNTEAEKAGNSGGPTNIAGNAWVGQQDSPLTDDSGISPRGIFDGVTNTIGYTQTSNTTTHYAYEACSRNVTGRFTRVVRKTSKQWQKTVTTAPVNNATRIERRTSQLSRRTWNTTLSTSQYKLQTTTITKSTSQSKWYNPATETTSPVASCSGLTGCTTQTTGPTVVASCSNVTGSAPDYIHVTCNTTTANTPVASCSGVGCTLLTSGPTAVAGNACPNGWGSNYVFNTCTVTNDTTSLVSSCSGTVYSASGNQTCSNVNDSGWVTVGSCTSSGGAYTGTPPTKTDCQTISYCTPDSTNNNCSATTVTTVGGSCTAGGNTTCTLITTAGPTAVDPATCFNDPTPSAGNGWTGTTCTNQDSAAVVDESCTPIAATAPGWIATLCTGSVSVAGVRAKKTDTTLTTRTYLDGSVTGPTSSSSSSYTSSCLDPATAPALPADATVVNPPVVVASTFSTGSSNSLADVAQYYYRTDLRPSMVNDVRASGTSWGADRANWQHMTTFVVGLGVSGTLNYQEDYSTATTGDFSQVRLGVKSWPRWPEPSLDYATYAQLYNDPRSIDDFWHAAVDGRGKYFSANNPDSVVSGIRGALAAIDASVAAGTSVSISDLAGFTVGGLSFASTYVTGRWTGDLQARSAATSTVAWSARSLLNTQVQSSCDDRNIYVRDTGASNNLGEFTWNTTKCATATVSNALSLARKASFVATGLSQYGEMSSGQVGQATGSTLVNYIRGQRQYEGFAPSISGKLYRSRDAVLGDIINSKPQYVAAPYRQFTDAGYAAFKTTWASRKPMIYVGANDGMLHAFYAPTESAPAADQALAGKEAWAYIPSAVIPKLTQLADNNYSGNHRFFVDGTPVVGDVKNASGWRTILVGGLNAGGKAFYALDITDPLQPKSLWEFDASSCAACDVGLSFGKPVIGKLKDGTWVVLLTSGYNNATGKGLLFVLDAVSGNLIRSIDTGVGSATSPSGLAQISAWVDFPGINDTIQRVYGGDLHGNIWRFDINDSIAPAGYEAKLMGIAKDSGATVQPITTAPEIGIWNKVPYVFVGTGSLLGDSDLSDTQRQSVYAIFDDLKSSATISNLRTALKPYITKSDFTLECSATAAVCAADNTKGWMVDLMVSKERVNLPLTLVGTTMVIVTNEPKAGVCTAGSTTRVYYAKGESGQTAAPGKVLSSNGIVGVTYVREIVADGTGYGGTKTKFKGSTTDVTGGNGADVEPPVTPPPSGTNRISWRELFF